MLKDNLIIFFPLVDWDGPWQRYQHLALHFSKNNHVVYVNSPVAITYLMRNPLKLAKKWVTSLRGRRKIGPNLTCYFPPPCLPFERMSKLVNFLNQYALFLHIKIFVKPKGSLILWINDPYKYFMIKLLQPKIAIYDCPDAIVFKKSNRKQKIYNQLKERVLRWSTVSFFTSKALLEKGRQSSRYCYYVPNGVDIGNFSQEKYATPEIIRNLRGKVLGLVGTFDERLDIDLLEFVVSTMGEATLVLVGPVKMNLGKLKKHPRVVLTGKREYKEIPSFIDEFDVALIPYRINHITNAVYPVKLHEYLILGKPVVSTNLPEVMQFAEVVWIANSQEKFVNCIEKALNCSDEKIVQKRKHIARMNSWEKRIDRIEKIVAKYC